MLGNIFLIPARAIAPDGSTMLRFSSKVSLIAAQISSVFTVTISGSTIDQSYLICVDERYQKVRHQFEQLLYHQQISLRGVGLHVHLLLALLLNKLTLHIQHR